MLSAVFSVIFTIQNSTLLLFFIQSKIHKMIVMIIVYLTQFGILIATNYDFSAVSYLSIASLMVSVGAIVMIIPMFQHVHESIIDEYLNEQKYAFNRENQFKKMFDSLQEGIIVMQKRKVYYMNDLSIKLLNHVSGLKDFYMNINNSDEVNYVNQMDVKIFYNFEPKNENKNLNKTKSTKKKHETGAFGKVDSRKVEYSLREISRLDTIDLKNKVFTFD